MIQLLLKILVFGAVVAFIHVFPFVVVVLAIFGVVKLWQILRGPKPPPGWRR